MELRYCVVLVIVGIVIYFANDEQWARRVDFSSDLAPVVLIDLPMAAPVDDKEKKVNEHKLNDNDAQMLDFVTKNWPVSKRQFNTSIWYTTGKKPVVRNYTYEETHRDDEMWTRKRG